MPSHVDDSLISTRSLEIPACSYASINWSAFAICASLSNDNLWPFKFSMNKINQWNQRETSNHLIVYLASTSVLTRPGIIFSISIPKRTKSLSHAKTTCSSTFLLKVVLKEFRNYSVCRFVVFNTKTKTYVESWRACSMAWSSSGLYCESWEAASKSEGLVVASVGLYFFIAKRMKPNENKNKDPWSTL